MKKLEIFMKYDKISNFIDHKALSYMDNSVTNQLDTGLWVDIDTKMFQNMLAQIETQINQQIRHHVSHL